MRKIVPIVVLAVAAGLLIWSQSGGGIFPRDRISSRILPADNEFPAAGVCAEAGNGSAIRVGVNSDIPLPRCQKVSAEDRLIVENNTDEALFMWFGERKGYAFSVPARGKYEIPEPLGELLAPGVHILFGSPYQGPEVWLQPTAAE